MNRKSLLTLTTLALCAVTGFAEHLLYDFEQPWQFEEWQTADAKTQTISPSGKFATSGKTSLMFKAESSDHYPELQVLAWENNWDPYEFVSFVLTNPNPETLHLKGFITENNGYQFWLTVPPVSSQEYIYRIKFPRFARKGNILHLTLKSQAKKDMEFYLDDLKLLKKEADPYLEEKKKNKKAKKRDNYTRPTSLAKEMKAHCRKLVAEKADSIGAYFDKLNLDLPAAKAALLKEAKDLKIGISRNNLSEQDTVEIVRDACRLTDTADRFKALSEQAKLSDDDKKLGFVVGFADPMHQVLPKHVTPDLSFAPEAQLSLAGNEKEAVQLALIPFTKAAKNVSVSAEDLKGPNGTVLKAKNIECDLVGFGKTPKVTSEDVTYVGWWPEALIRNPKPISVEVGDIQTWWIRVRAPKGQAPGLYKGSLTIKSANGKPVKVGLNVQVYDFNLPLHAPIPTMITYGVNEGEAKKHKILGGVDNWNKKLKYIHADFLADYLISYDNIYRSKTKDKGKKPSVDWELMKYLRDKGTLGPINFGLFYDSKDKTVDEYKLNYKEAKKLGVLDKCYIYGFDEQPSWAYPDIEKASQKFKKNFPEVLVMTTSQDHSYGFDSPMKTLTGWCPIINRYNPTLAEKARKEGRRIWWYTCCWPKHPYPNIYVDYPAVDSRVMMGWMTAKYKPDGFLYFHTTIWKKEDWDTGITEYPYTNWHTYNFMSTNGDGSMTCIDSKGYPVATIRLENYRDGLEDLAYYMILEHKVKLAEKKRVGADWVKQAKQALSDVDKLVATRYRYNMDAQTNYDYRTRLAELIQSSPIKDDNPWKKGLSVWGLEGRPRRK